MMRVLLKLPARITSERVDWQREGFSQPRGGVGGWAVGGGRGRKIIPAEKQTFLLIHVHVEMNLLVANSSGGDSTCSNPGECMQKKKKS